MPVSSEGEEAEGLKKKQRNPVAASVFFLRHAEKCFTMLMRSEAFLVRVGFTRKEGAERSRALLGASAPNEAVGSVWLEGRMVLKPTGFRGLPRLIGMHAWVSGFLLATSRSRLPKLS